MAYSKTTWNNLSAPPINADNLNKIEQGIYDNSIDITSINTLIGSSGTATTTQTDYTEGQLTQKLGLKYIKMKGQTSQYTTTGKNLLGLIDGTYTQGTITATVKNGTITLNGTASSNTFLDISTENYDLVVGTAYTITINNPVATTNSGDIRFRTESSGSYDVYLGNTNASRTITLASNDDLGNKITIRIASGVVLTNFKLTPMIETGSTATSYEPYTNGASPNPSYPQDVNNVTGSNVIKVCNKNLSSGWEYGDIVSTTGVESDTTNAVRLKNYIPYDTSTTYRLSVNSSTPNASTSLRFYNKNKEYIGYAQLYASGGSNFTVNVQTSVSDTTPKYIRLRMSNTVATPSDNIMLTNTSDLTYVAHREEDYEINLGKNLFNKDDSSVIFNGFVNGSTLKLVSNANSRTICLPCKTNTTYTISKILSARFITAETTSTTIAGDISVTINSQASTTTSHTITTSANAKYLLVFYYLSSSDTLSEEEIRNSIQIEVGSQATSYADYFPPIELCKIGDYQDYIYKNNGKWFIHKEIGKLILNGTETWNSMGWTDRYAYRVAITDMKQTTANSDSCSAISNYYKAFSQNDLFNVSNTYGIANRTNTNELILRNDDCTTGTALTTALSTNNVTIYYQKATPTDEEITYEPLLRQLDKLDKIGLYDISNISQDNSDMKMLLDFIICNDNYNGLREFIRA